MSSMRLPLMRSISSSSEIYTIQLSTPFIMLMSQTKGVTCGSGRLIDRQHMSSHGGIIVVLA